VSNDLRFIWAVSDGHVSLPSGMMLCAGVGGRRVLVGGLRFLFTYGIFVFDGVQIFFFHAQLYLLGTRKVEEARRRAEYIYDGASSTWLCGATVSFVVVMLYYVSIGENGGRFTTLVCRYLFDEELNNIDSNWYQTNMHTRLCNHLRPIKSS
jgi:hypothetical protein